MPIEEKDVILILADISGYTRFMTINEKSEVHSQIVIGELMKSIIEKVKIPLKVAKLEGDAIFLYAKKADDEAKWEAERILIGEKLLEFFSVFANTLVELSQSKLCTCNSCRNLDKLKLKVIVHSGKALFQKIHDYEELGGVDVIVAHLLLKNHVKKDHYILLTHRAYGDLALPKTIPNRKHIEKYDEVGMIRTHVYIPPDKIPCPAAYFQAETAKSGSSI